MLQQLTLMKGIIYTPSFVLEANLLPLFKFNKALLLFCRYDVALAINTMGALNVLNFAKLCPAVKMLLHISTGNI